MADEYDDEERRLRRLLGDYAPDEEQWFPSEPDGAPSGTSAPEPGFESGGGEFQEPAAGAPSGASAPEAGFESGGGEFQEPAAAAPPQFNPQAEVARMTAPPPPPIRVYAHTPGGLQEISQVEGSQGQPVSGGGDPVAMGSAGQALLNREQQIRSDPQLSPAERSRALAHIHQLAGQLALQSAIHGHGAPAQAMEGQFSTPQQQQLARLDAAEDQANQKFASGEYKPESYWPVMAQIAEQRQAIKSKMVPKGPTMQEKFDADAVKLADGTVLHPTYHSNGTISGYKPIEPKHVEHLNTMLKQNPYDSPHDVALHVASLEAETRGLPAHPNLPPLHGPTGTGHGKGASSMAEYEPPDQLKLREQALKEIEAEHTTTTATGTKSVSPHTNEELEARVERLNYLHHKSWDDHKAVADAKAKAATGQGRPPGAPPPPQGAPPPPPPTPTPLDKYTWDPSKPPEDREVGLAADNVKQIFKTYGRVPAQYPRDVQKRYVGYLKLLKERVDPSIKIPPELE